jgi:hypothetical protein
MNIRLIFTALLAFCVLLLPVGAYSGEPEFVTVKADGRAEAKVEDNVDIKKMAVEDALKKAVMEAVKIIIKDKGAAPTPAILESAALSYINYVLNYKVLSEGQEEAAVPEAEPGATEPGVRDVAAYKVSIEANIDAGLVRETFQEAMGGYRPGTEVVTVVALDMPDYAALGVLKDAFARLPAVKDVAFLYFSRVKIVIEVKSAVSRSDFAVALKKELGDGFVVADAQGKVAVKYIIR